MNIMFTSILYELLSRFLSIPDLLFPLFNSFPGWPKFFPQGYGNPKVYFDRRNWTLKALAEGSFDLEGTSIHLEDQCQNGSVLISQGHFLSPLAHLLPKEAQTCHFQLVEPASQCKNEEVYVFMFPSTGEMGGSARRAMAQSLADKHGWSSVILTAPFYGQRKPASQKLFFIDTVTKILLQSEGIIEEGMLLTSWLLKRNKDAVVCHTGFSYGGAMASCASAMCLVAGIDGSRIACAPYAGSASPNVLANGVLESCIDWKKLANTPDEPYEITRKRLYDLFDETQLTVLAKPRRGKIAAAKCLSFSHDAFIQPQYSLALKSQIGAISSSPVELQWYPGGHAFAALARRYLQQRLIENTVKELVSKVG